MSDPNFSSVQLLAMNDNAANTTSSFIDQSSFGRAITRDGTPTYSNTTAPTNMSTAGAFTTAGWGLHLSPVSAFALAGDFTIEWFWYFPVASVAGATAWWKKSSGTLTYDWLINGASNNGIFFSATTDANLATPDIADGIRVGPYDSTTTVPTTTWVYFAVKRSGSNITTAAGTSGATTAGTTATSSATSSCSVTAGDNLFLGDNDNSDDATGRMACMRLTIGFARDISTVPSLPFGLAGTTIGARRTFSPIGTKAGVRQARGG
jgi:hypothetical protein